jgi:2-polyprenyl-3-methyl-5-hydroxy-6-metoxy-1,4-benzoquinol methylase
MSPSELFRRDFSRRSQETEWLDQADLDPKALENVLDDLARFNRAMLGYRPILSWLRRAVEVAPHGRPWNLVDVGCGHGDLLRVIRRWANRQGLVISLRGIDISAQTIRIARAATDRQDQIDFEVTDLFRFRPAEPVDLVVCSLFTHHLADSAITDFLRWMETTASRGWLISDLQRHPLPYYFIGLIGRLTRIHPVVISDGRISVSRALTRKEWETRLRMAGVPMQSVTVRWFLFRYLIGRLS